MHTRLTRPRSPITPWEPNRKRGLRGLRIPFAAFAISIIAIGTARADSGASAETKNPHVWEPKTQSVSIFKNGFGFFTRRGNVHLSDGWAYGRDIPPAAFGTLAVYAHDAEQTVDVVGAGPGEIVEFDGISEAADEDTKRRRLNSCVGLSVELSHGHSGETRTSTGTVVSVGPEYVVLEADSQTLAVRIAEVERMRILELPLRVHVSRTDDASPTQADLGIAYLRGGIMWIPEYTLNVIDDETAELTLRGTLVNEAEDLIHCDVSFVVGVPHFVHSDLMSPVAVGTLIRSLGSNLPTAGVPQQVMSQMMNRAAIANNFLRSEQFDSSGQALPQGSASEEGDLSGILANLPQMDSPASGDFTVYTKENLTVRRGERAIVTLFTHRIPYRHLYRWNTVDPVEHFLTLQNTAPTAWTTGPCLALAEGNPLSEEVLRYTPRNGHGDLKVTTAINVAHERTEVEADRSLKAHEPRNNEFYDMVTIAGSIRLKNFESKPIEIHVEAPIDGRPVAADQDGKIRIDVTKLRLVERAGTIEWHVTLEPNEEIQMSYRYERYVPSS